MSRAEVSQYVGLADAAMVTGIGGSAPVGPQLVPRLLRRGPRFAASRCLCLGGEFLHPVAGVFGRGRSAGRRGDAGGWPPVHRDDDLLTGRGTLHKKTESGLGISKICNHVVIVVSLSLVGQFGRGFPNPSYRSA